MTAIEERPGLEGVIAAHTALSRVDGQAGRLIYEGYDIGELAGVVSFEEVAHLLWRGQLPTPHELAELRAIMAAARPLPAPVLNVLRALPTSVAPMDALRTALSAYGSVGGFDTDNPPTYAQAIAVTAVVPTVLAAFDRLRARHEPITPRADLGHAANFLYMLHGTQPDAAHVRALDSYMVLLADHGLNASTFAARVVASTRSDMISAVVAAIGALKGPLHGGAPALVLDMVQAIGNVTNVESWLRASLERGERLMGFGHRVYKTTDPRAEILREMARAASDPDFFALVHETEERGLALLAESKPGHKLYTNVEFYSAAVLHAVGLPGDLFTPTFAAARTAGWTAHILEQTGDNRLIRPESRYTGPAERHLN